MSIPTQPRRPRRLPALPVHLIGDGEGARRGLSPTDLDTIRAAHAAGRTPAELDDLARTLAAR